jgi:hypothetical protein
MTVYFASSDVQDFEKLTNNAPLLDTNASFRNSTWSPHSISLTQSGGSTLRITLPSPMQEVWVAFSLYSSGAQASGYVGYLKFDNSSVRRVSADTAVWNIYSTAANGRGYFGWNTQNFYGDSTAVITTAPSASISNAWVNQPGNPNRVVLQYKANSPGLEDGIINLWVNNTLITSFSGNVNNSTLIDQIYFGGVTTANSQYLSQFLVADEDIRDTFVETVALDAVDVNNGWAAFDGGSLVTPVLTGSNTDLINSSFIFNPSEESILTYSVVAPPVEAANYSLLYLQSSLNARRTITGPAEIAPYFVIDSTPFEDSGFPLDLVYRPLPNIFQPTVWRGYPINPATQQPWALSDMAGLKVGVKSTGA